MKFKELEVWTPGSFTKNFSWGREGSGLSRLYFALKQGFEERLEDIPRDVFWENVSKSGSNPYIVTNFFAFNYKTQDNDCRVQ